MAAEKKKWKLNMGCHDGTFASRDSSIEEYDSLNGCKEAVVKAEACWSEIGYFVRFADAYGPDGEKETLHPRKP